MRTVIILLAGVTLGACSSCDHLVVERQVIEQQAEGYVSHSERTDSRCER